uniref:Uncharacterized protein LOC113788441 n=1 Tax=Dermatophagoides pteronyssinus TaxID=6956 RepID=A0A6P6XP83_DERPT|nr:uncharacterized protein LOC113788441 [Dermatophagoides pteronyssinus]
MTCLDPTGRRPSKFRCLKAFFLTIFGITGTQLFPLIFHFIRLVSYFLMDRQTFLPKPLPKGNSLFGLEIFQHDLNFNDNSSSVYTVQVIVAAIASILIGLTGFMAICREKLTTMKIYSFIMLLITFVTGFGSFCLPNLVHWTNIILPLLGGSVSSLLSFVFTLLTQQQLDQENPSSYHNYYPYNNQYN